MAKCDAAHVGDGIAANGDFCVLSVGFNVQEMDFLAEEYALALEYYSTFLTDEKISE